MTGKSSAPTWQQDPRTAGFPEREGANWQARYMLEKLDSASENISGVGLLLEWHNLSHEQERTLQRIAVDVQTILTKHGKAT